MPTPRTVTETLILKLSKDSRDLTTPDIEDILTHIVDT